MQNGSVSDFGYTNNAIGNRTAMSRAGSAFITPDTISYSYNIRSEVIGAVSNQNSAYNYAYSFDPIGNRLTANLAGTSYNYTTNMLNQYTVVNSNQPTYDDDGNMLTNGSWTYTWNGEKRMVQAVNGNTKLQFVYDYMGRRIEKKVFDGDAIVSYKRFVYDNYKQVEELDALNSNSVLKHYSWQPEAVGLDVPLSMTDVATAKNYAYTLDANKNVSDLTDAQGNVVAHYEYSPFGTHVATGSYTGNPFRFSSEVYPAFIIGLLIRFGLLFRWEVPYWAWGVPLLLCGIASCAFVKSLEMGIFCIAAMLVLPIVDFFGIKKAVRK